MLTIQTDGTVLWDRWKIGVVTLDNPARDRFKIGQQEWDFGAMAEDAEHADEARARWAAAEAVDEFKDALREVLESDETRDEKMKAIIALCQS